MERGYIKELLEVNKK